MSKEYEKYRIHEAIGASEEPFLREEASEIREIGREDGFDETFSSIDNTFALNKIITEISNQGGGTILIPKGEYRLYTIEIKSGVRLIFTKDTNIYAAGTSAGDIANRNEKTGDYDYSFDEGDGGNYLEPEVFLYAGIQDHGHSYFANSLFFASEAENISIEGGNFFGYVIDEKTKRKKYTLFGTDPEEPRDRLKNGYSDFWFGNKVVAFVNCKNVKLESMKIVVGGHFAILCTGVKNLLLRELLVDTNRDAIDIDACENVTVRNVVTNSLTDDGIVLKASFGAGTRKKCRNVLIEDCTVMGYDAGSVFDGTYTENKKVAEDLDGPTGRIKLGTEGTCGFERITVRNTKFERSRGFAIESVDGADIKDVIFENCVMTDVSSSPLFIIAGDRGRCPVTGLSADTHYPLQNDVRIDNPQWVIPDSNEFQKFPPKRYTASIVRDVEIKRDGKRFFIVNQKEPLRYNENNVLRNDKGEYFEKQSGKGIREEERFLYANANGSERLSKIDGVLFKNIRAFGADSRYPIILMGMVDSKISNVFFEDIKIEYEGGLSLNDAVEENVVLKKNTYRLLDDSEVTQTLQMMVNPFFAKNEVLLVRRSFSKEKQKFTETPCNVPEMPGIYPEPSAFGILPAFGLYFRHAQNISIENMHITTKKTDERYAVVFDDVEGIHINNLVVKNDMGRNHIALVRNNYKRHTNREYVPNEPYFKTGVSGLVINGDVRNCLSRDDCIDISIDAPSPGTPKDERYIYPTVFEMAED